MSLKPFSFLNTEPTTPEGKNWRTFDEASKTIVKTNLTIVNPVSTPAVETGYFTMYGPIIFYTISIVLNNGDGWGTNSYISVPFVPLQSTNFLAPHLGQGFVGITGTVRSTVVFKDTSNPSRLGFVTAYTNATGSDERISIQGWYYRN